MNLKGQLICAWSAPVGLMIFGVAVWPLAGFLPPISPALGPEPVAAIFRDNALAIKLATILLMLAFGLFCAFIAEISVQLKRIEGRSSPFAYTQMIAGLAGFIPLMIVPLIWCAAAFRPDRPPELIQLLNDIGWMMFISTVWPPIVQMLAIGLAILWDKNAERIFPRWLAYANFWLAVLFVPGGFLSLFKTGPFAWDGIIAFWVPAGSFGTWVMLMFVMLLKAIRRQQSAEAQV